MNTAINDNLIYRDIFMSATVLNSAAGISYYKFG